MKLFKWLKKRIQLFQLSKRINSSEVEIVNIYQADTTNVGDLMCAPFLYFPELQRKSITVSIMNFCNDINFKNKIIILGGVDYSRNTSKFLLNGFLSWGLVTH